MKSREGFDDSKIWAKRFVEGVRGTGQKISLFIWGTTGNGKTLLQACAFNKLEEEKYNCLFSNLSIIFGRMHDYKTVKHIEIYDIIRRLDALFIDDFGVEALNTTREEWLFNIIDIVDKHEIPVFISANNIEPQKFQKNIHMKRVFSRLIGKCKIIENKSSDYRIENR